MKKFRILLIALLSIIFTFTLFACGGGGSKRSEDIGEEEEISSIIDDSEVNSDSSIDGSATTLVTTQPSTNVVTTKPSTNVVTTKPSSNATTSATSSKPVTTYTVTITSSTGGTVTADKTSGVAGTSVTLSVSATSGYQLEWLKVNGNKVTVSNNKYTFTLNANTTITYSFVKVYSVTITSSTGGTVTADKTSGVAGTSIKLTITPTSGYKLDWLKVNGSAVTVSGTSYTFSLTANTTITYSFVKVYSISITQSANGTVTADKTTAKAGEIVKFTITPASNYQLKSFKINGTAVTVSGNTYSYTMGSANVTVTYEFARVYSITKASTTNGTFALSVNSAVAGQTVTVTATPSSGYLTSEISITYGTITTKLDVTSNKATFTMPSSDVSVKVTFGVADSREYVSHLILGDSYTHHEVFWHDFYSDFSHLPAPKIIGIGGTQVPQWGKDTTKFVNTPGEPGNGLNGNITQFQTTTNVNILGKYNVANFVFHIGVNDIDAGFAVDNVFSDLKTLFTEVHNSYPNANIYWISLSLNTMFPQYTSSYISLNSKMKTYCATVNYLNYLDTCSKMFPDGTANPDMFQDGLHYNADGYATWSSYICEGLGYPKPKVSVFGNANKYYSSNTWKESNGVVSNTTNKLSQQSLYFDGIYSVDAYAEAKVTVNSVANSDEYPKFGMSVKTNGNNVFFFVDAVNTGAFGTAKGVSFTENKVRKDDGGGNYSETIDWNWTIQKWSTAALNYGYTNGTYVKLGLLRSGRDMYFFVNDVLALSMSGFEYCDGEGAIGFTVFNLNVSIKDYSVTTNISSKISSLGITTGGSSYFEGAKDEFTNNAGNEVFVYQQNISKSKLYFEADITAIAALNGDKWPKFGLALTASSGASVYFYVDPVDDGKVPFGTGKNVGFISRAAGAGDDWSILNIAYVPTMNYSGTSVVKLAIYKDGARIVGLVNGVAVLETSKFTSIAGDVKVGVRANNVNLTVKNAKLSVGNTILNTIASKYGIKNDLTIDANLSDWSATQKANPYSFSATDNSGRKVTVYAFMGTNGIYVGYEAVHKTYVTTDPNWYINTNAEMFGGAGKVQAFCSANGQTQNLKAWAMKTVQNGSLYTTTVEMVLPFVSFGYTGSEESVKLGFAFKTGGETGAGMTNGTDGDWWCGPRHAEHAQSTVLKAGGITA